MIDPETARRGCLVLSTAIAEVMEDHASAAGTFGAAGNRAQTAAELMAAGQAITTLAAALVLLSRAQPD